MLTVGQDTYITVEQADEYVSKHYRTNSKDKKRWSDLEEVDKEVILRNACMELESLPWIGRRASGQQTLSFPRLPLQYGRSQEPPQAIKHAQAELALWLSDDDRQSEQVNRRDLQLQGVTSFSIGDLSESYGEGVGEKSAPLLCLKVKTLVAPYLNGGYDIC